MKQVLKDRVLVEKIKIENKNSILDIVEDESENKPLSGKVIKIGKHVEDVAVDDIILYKDSDSLPITVEGKNLLILREFDIIGII